jgi:intracellular multiplication protein IcmO
MSNEKKNSNSKPDDADAWFRMGAILVVGCLVLALSATALLSTLWAYVLYQAWRDRKGQSRLIRVPLVFLLGLATVYYLVGPPEKRADQKLTETFFAGALYLDFFETTRAVYAWAYQNALKYLKLDHRFAFSHVRLFFYAPFFLGTALALGIVLLGGTSERLKNFRRPGFYRGLRWLTRAFYSPLIVLPLGLALEGSTLFAIGTIFVQAAAGLGLSYWLGITLLPTLGGAIWHGALWYFGTGSCLAIYSAFFGAEASAYRGASRAPRPDLIPIGEDLKSGNEIWLSLSQLQHHLHVLGASGFGKTTFLLHLIRHHVNQGLGLIFIDLKADAELVERLSAWAKAAGRAGDLQILDLSRPELSLAYNPCARGNATEIKDKIVGSFEWESEYYKNASQSFLLTVLRALCFLRDQKRLRFTLEDLYAATLSPDALVKIEGLLNEHQAPTGLKEEVNDLAQYLRGRENYRELQGLRTQLQLLLSSEFGECLKSDRNGIDFFEAIQGERLVYVLLDSQTYGETAKKLGKLILQDLKSCSGEIITRVPKENRTHCTVIVDEFADLATEQFVGLLNRARGSKLGIVIAHQEIADLEAQSKSIRDQVMTNTSTTISFLQKVPESAERLAGLAGTRTAIKRTRQLAEDDGIIFKSQVYTGVESEREVEEYEIHPNEIKRLSPGQCVVIGKYPHAWSAKVQVFTPETTGRGPESPENRMTAILLLRELKRLREQEATGFFPLGLRSNRAGGGEDSPTGPGLFIPPSSPKPPKPASDAFEDRF